jgi:hypothetical protein
MALQSPNMHENGTNCFVSNYVMFTVLVFKYIIIRKGTR